MPFRLLLTSQFLSAMADNALLIWAVVIAQQASNLTLIPILQGLFLLPFILLAPFVGALSDYYSKTDVLKYAQLIKLVGLMFVFINPFVGFFLVGAGSALYSPAKYGILTQMFDKDHLVKANGSLESFTIIAILSGILIGGMLTNIPLDYALLLIAVFYLFSSVVTRWMPKYPSEISHIENPLSLIKSFYADTKELYTHKEAGVTLIASSAFWANGVVLKMAVFVWAPVAIGLSTTQDITYFIMLMSLGVIIGALIAAKQFTIDHYQKVIVYGSLMGAMVSLLAFAQSIYIAGALLIVIGVLGGMYLVPINAKLQHEGHHMMGVGKSLAVQNFSENLAMILGVGIYTLLSLTLSVEWVLLLFGLCLFVGLFFLYHFSRKDLTKE